MTLPDILPTLIQDEAPFPGFYQLYSSRFPDRKLDKGLGMKPSPCISVDGRKNVWQCYDVGL